MEQNEELVKNIQEQTGFKKEFALHLAKKIDELNKHKEYNGFSLKQKISTALNQMLNQTS